MRAADLTTAAVLIAGSLIVLWDAVRLGIGWGTDGPKSGFFPFWLAAIMLIACVGIVARAWRRAHRQPFVSRHALRPVLTVLLPAAGFILAMEWLGFYVAAFLYLAFYMRWLGRYAWPMVALGSLAFPMLTFLVF